ncbi:hypothetical protein B9G55_11365 [Saccharibacillus sp. O16]|nr:hypothetical protein B9G55_11365 [Saccharibacillus sp. O16]
MMKTRIGKRMAVAAALAAALCLQVTAQSASAAEVEAASAAVVMDSSAPVSLETASAELKPLRGESGEMAAGVGAEASVVNVLETAQAEGKGFSVFCISLALSLALMLGVFGLMMRRSKHRRH